MENIEILMTKDNYECIILHNENKSVCLGSKYNFENDRKKLINSLKDVNIQSKIIINGLYNGEYLEELNSILTKENKAFILEFNKDIYNNFKYKCEKYKNIEVIYYEKDSKEVQKMLNFIEMNIRNIICVNFGNYDRVYSAEIGEFITKLKEYVVGCKIEINTMNLFKDVWFECYVNNIKNILSSDYITNYKEVYKGYPAVIVSAGPSLKKNIHLLKNIEDKAVIVANGRTLKVLKKYNIKPTYVCVVDPGEASYRIIKDDLECMAPLVFDELTNKDVVDKYYGNKINYSNVYMSNISKDILNMKEQVSLFQGGSVAHTSVDFARYIGCDPIVLIGQDLAYTENKVHADNAAETNNIAEEYDLIVDGIDGESVKTSYTLDYFKIKFEEYFKENKNVNFINATEGGALIKGCENKSFIDIVKKYENSKNIPEIKFQNYFSDENVENSKIKIKEFMCNFKVINKWSYEILKLNKKYYDYSKKNLSSDEKLSKQIEKKEKQILKRINSLKFLQTMLDPIIQTVLKDPEYTPKKDSNFLEKLQMIYEKTECLYERIIESTKLAENIICKSYGEDLERF